MFTKREINKCIKDLHKDLDKRQSSIRKEVLEKAINLAVCGELKVKKNRSGYEAKVGDFTLRYEYSYRMYTSYLMGVDKDKNISLLRYSNGEILSFLKKIYNTKTMEGAV